MRTNGYIYYLTTNADPQFDEDGIPTAAQSIWSDAIPCHIRTTSSTSKGKYEDGTFHQATYEVLTERSAIPLDTQKVRLIRNGVELGFFQVQGYPEDVSLDRIKIVV